MAKTGSRSRQAADGVACRKDMFVCLFVCLFVGIKPEKVYSASCVGREVNPLGVITHGQRHKPRAYQRQRYKPRTCQSMVNTLQVDGLACIPGYDKDHICRILNHRTACPHALYDVLVLDGGRVKTMNGLVDRDCVLLANTANLNKT